MASNREILELWLETACAELGELARVQVTAGPAEDVPLPARTYRSQLLFEGAFHGSMYVSVSAAGMVQLGQMVAGKPIDPRAVWTEEGLEAWQSWLNASSGKLAARLSRDFPEFSEGACTILLRETTALEGVDLDSEGDMHHWSLRVGDTEIALSVSAEVEFSREEVAASPQDAVNAASTAQEDEQEQGPTSVAEPDAPLPSAGPPSFDGEPVSQHAQQETRDFDEERPAAPQQADLPRGSEPNAVPSEWGNKQRLDLLLDIELEATLRFGSLEMPLREVLELGPGDVLPLDRHVREPVDLVVGDRIVARGEVVLVSGNFALHVTEVAEPRRRLETIRCLF
ncbi:MAG: FliM/FliN family flagellar motor C-terminal domain-containing protein [Acidobacteriaceae bacterium]